MKKTKQFIVGLALGLALGGAAYSYADNGDKLEQGFLMGWTVVDNEHEFICFNPYVWPSLKQIACF